jgi:hypothetical protein
MTMEKMWLVLVEIVAETDNSLGSKIGFMNITTWADSRGAACSKIEHYLKSFGWHMVSVDKANIIDEQTEYSDDVVDMIDRTRSNPNAIILGTFHTYKAN